MADLVTLEEAKLFIKIPNEIEDPVIAMLITAASDAVRDVATDWDGEGEVPDRIKLAVLMRVGALYHERDSLEPSKGELAFLQPLRTLEV